MVPFVLIKWKISIAKGSDEDGLLDLEINRHVSFRLKNYILQILDDRSYEFTFNLIIIFKSVNENHPKNVIPSVINKKIDFTRNDWIKFKF